MNYLRKIESEITKQKFGKNPHSLYEPLRYIMQLGGKRLRPTLTILSYSLYKDDPEPAIPMAVAMETFHNFTLLHDDIMDKAPLRRGKPTVHEKWNTSTAILAGDVMLVKVYDMLMKSPDAHLREVLGCFNRCAIAVCEGQQWDMEFETKKTVSEAQYLNMIRQKTAVLLGCCLEVGAIIAKAPDADRQALYQFGVEMGIGFQLKDDLLDVYGDTKKFGKQVGGDIIANKKTFLLIKALSLARGQKKKDLNYWLSLTKFDKRKKIKAVTEIYDALNLKAITEKKINDRFAIAFTTLNHVSADETKICKLKDFAMEMVRRQA